MRKVRRAAVTRNANKVMKSTNANLTKNIIEQKKAAEKEEVKVLRASESKEYFEANKNLGPPYHILLDTSFLNKCIQTKQDLFESIMNCLLAKGTPYVTDCVIAELERYGRKFGLALRLARDPRVKRLTCNHEGFKNYGDDCIVHRVTASRCYIVASQDGELRRRLRKIPGVPIMFCKQDRFTIERLAEKL